MRVSVLELPARWNDVGASLDDVDALLGDGPTDLAILPELALTGYVSPGGRFDLRPFAEPLDGPTATALGDVSRRRRTHLLAPLVLAEPGERGEPQCSNAAVLFDPSGAPVAVYRKRHPWFPERWATPGRTPPPLVRVADVTVTFAICFDAHFLDEDTAAELARADLLAFTSAWVDEEDSRVPLLRRTARTHGVAIANANWGAGVVVVPGQGGSCVLDARGDVVATVPAGRGARRADAHIHPRTSPREKI